MVSPRAWSKRCSIVLFVSLVAGCVGDDIVIPEPNEPFLYLVLNEATLEQSLTGTIGQHAQLVTIENVLESPVFRAARTFEMRVAATGELFDWRQHDARGRDVGSYPAHAINAFNFFLPADPAPGLLGAFDQQALGTYTLLVETGDATIQGTATIPDTFSVTILRSESPVRLVWPSVEGAAGYRIEVPDRAVRVQTDTVFPLPDGVTAGEVDVIAMDENLYRYTTDPELARSGIDEGLGVFGAIMPAR